MIDEIVSIQNQISQFVNEYFIPQLKVKLKNQKEFINDIDSKINEYLLNINENEHEKFLAEKSKEFHSKIFLLIENCYLNNSRNSFDEDFQSFINQYSQYIPSIISTYRKTQDDERFIPLKDNSGYIKFLKKIKKFLFNLRQIPIKSGNVFRKLFKKPLKPKKNWHQDIPLRGLAEYFSKEELSHFLLDEIEKVYAVISTTSLNLLKACRDIDNNIFDKNIINEDSPRNEKANSINNYKKNIKESLSAIDAVESSIKQNSVGIIEKIFVQFDEAFQKVDTIELSKNNFSQHKIKRLHDELNQKYIRIVSGWNINLFALFDEWRLYEELIIVTNTTIEESISSLEECRNKIDKFVLPNMNLIKDYLEKSKKAVAEFNGDGTKLENLLAEEKEKNSNLLTAKIVPQTIETLLDQNIPALIDEFDVKLDESIQTVSKKRAIVKTDIYDQKLKNSDIDYISPYEVIISETLPEIKKSTKEIKKEILENIDKIQKSILDLDQIADFNLESAIALITIEKKPAGEAKELALEGLERALNKTDETKKSLQNLIENISDKLNKAASGFNEEILDLTNTEKVFQIKLRVAKAKAIEKTKRYQAQAVNYVKNIIPVLVSKSKQSYSFSRQLYSNLKKRLGIIPPVRSISSEVSDFLAETQSAIAKLPFVYQRLFKVEPLADERFFEGRVVEQAKLDLAYTNWLKGYFAPSVIVGEKGSGATSIINIFLRKKEFNLEIIRTVFQNSIFEEDQFIKFFRELLKNDSFENLDDIAKYLNNFSSKKIIIIENIQHSFLRKVNGFICLRMLFELVSKTSRQIFWIVTSTLYAWNYLDKTLNISDHFAYMIKLEELDYSQMIELILKRHRVSGYNIYFEPSQKDLNDKHYKKLSENEKQEYLKKEYFKSLNNFAKSNISLALLFWLRSTQSVTADTITIQSLNDLDFSFLASLSAVKIFTLHIMLLHDGITEEIHSLIFDQSPIQSRLLLYLLLDDGVIVKYEDKYFINPLLYRQSVSLLQAKNIIH